MRLATKWQAQFPIHFSSKARPNRPNANRDQFAQTLADALETAKVPPENAEALLSHALEQYNTRLAQPNFLQNQKAVRVSDHIRVKCEATGCWLFVFPPDVLATRLAAQLQSLLLEETCYAPTTKIKDQLLEKKQDLFDCPAHSFCSVGLEKESIIDSTHRGKESVRA